MIYTDSECGNTTENHQQINDEVISDNKIEKHAEVKLPSNRVIRKRLAARTIGIHLSALPPELQVLKVIDDTIDNAYLAKRDLPDEIYLTISSGEKKLFSRDEAWDYADEAGSKLEWDILPDTISGKATALFSTTGQGIYANYGRPTMDFSGFFYDYIRISEKLPKASIATKGRNSVMLGPIFIAADTVSAAGFTALGHVTRGARLTNKTVLADIASTGVYEGSTSWTSAKLGVFTGAKAIRFATTIPIPGVHLAAIPIGFLVGATTAIFAKHFANQYKDKAIDTLHEPVINSETSEVTREIDPA